MENEFNETTREARRADDQRRGHLRSVMVPTPQHIWTTHVYSASASHLKYEDDEDALGEGDGAGAAAGFGSAGAAAAAGCGGGGGGGGRERYRWVSTTEFYDAGARRTLQERKSIAGRQRFI